VLDLCVDGHRGDFCLSRNFFVCLQLNLHMLQNTIIIFVVEIIFWEELITSMQIFVYFKLVGRSLKVSHRLRNCVSNPCVEIFLSGTATGLSIQHYTQWVSGTLSLKVRSQDSSVSTVTRIRTGRPGFDSRQRKEYSLRQRVQTGSGAHSTYYPMDTRSFFPRGIKLPAREADHSPPSCAEAKTLWSYTSTPPHTFMAWCLIKQRICLDGVVLTFT